MCLTKSSPTRPSSTRTDSSSSGGGSTRTDLSTRARSAARPTCARVRVFFIILLPFFGSGHLARQELELRKKDTHPGDELEAFMQRHGGWDQFDKVVYIGDGGNDLCPILRLRACVSLSLSFFPLDSLTTRSQRGSYTPQSRRRARPHVPRTVSPHRRHVQRARVGPQVQDCLVGRSVGGRKVLQGAALNHRITPSRRPSVESQFGEQ